MYKLYFIDPANGKKIWHTHLLYYHLPIILNIITEFFINLSRNEWKLVIFYVLISLFVYPLHQIISKSGKIAEWKSKQVLDIHRHRISAALFIGLLDLSAIIFAIIGFSAFLTLLIYHQEKPFKTFIDLYQAADYTCYVFDVKGFKDVAVVSTEAKVLSFILWAVSLTIPAIVIGFWLKAFENIFASFK